MKPYFLFLILIFSSQLFAQTKIDTPQYRYAFKGYLNFSDEKKIAIEVELTMKGGDRLEKILRGYGGQTEISEAWYFCADSVMRKVAALSKKRSFVKIYSIKEFLHG